LASFLLSIMKVRGHMQYKAPLNPPTSTRYISCRELDNEDNLRHHLYLQARLEMGYAYLMYNQMGFTMLAVKNGPCRCFSYCEQCPIRVAKVNKVAMSCYITDNGFLQLLILKRWLINAYPPALAKPSTVDSATNIWNAHGLSPHEFQSSTLISPLNNPNTCAFTNSAYLQLLKGRSNVGRNPIHYYTPFGHETFLMPLQVDRILSHMIRSDPSKHMIAGLTCGPSDIPRTMFRSLVAFVGEKVWLYTFQAIAASLYTEGKGATTDHDLFSHSKMTLELRLNVVAFY
jgi:hypothetical protein